jgi:hypothetical protein
VEEDKKERKKERKKAKTRNHSDKKWIDIKFHVHSVIFYNSE